MVLTIERNHELSAMKKYTKLEVLPPNLADATRQCALTFSPPDQLPIRDAIAAATAYSTLLATYVGRTFDRVTVQAALAMRVDANQALEDCLRDNSAKQPRATARDVVLVGYRLDILPRFYIKKSISHDLVDAFPDTLTWGQVAKLGGLVERAPDLPPRPPRVNRDAYYACDEIETDSLGLEELERCQRLWDLADQVCHGLIKQAVREEWTVTQLEREVSIILRRKPRGRPSLQTSAPPRLRVPAIPV